MKIEDILQIKLNLLESGESLDTCMDGASQEVVDALRLVNFIRNLEVPEIDPEVADAQRSHLMSIINPKTVHEKDDLMNDNKIQTPFLKNGRTWTVALAISAAAVFVFCALITIGFSGFWLLNQGKHEIAQKIPAFSPEPEAAVLVDQKGFVDIMVGDQWSQASKVKTPIKPGMHIRTGSISSVHLSLLDGSQVKLGPEAELVIEELNVQTEEGPRTVIFTQLAGTSEHEVSHAKDENSRYEVRTASATGTALGTVFKVQVKPDQSAWFSVLEGEVAVTGNNETVMVETGEATVATPDTPPADPEFFFTGSGKVTYIGETWVIADQVLATHPGTTIMGNPIVGDLVFFEGRLLPNDTRIVDLIILLRRSPENHFSITGTVTLITDDIWTVNGQEIAVTDITDVQGEIGEGDLILIQGAILPGGEFQAEKIKKLDDEPGLNFDFKGIVEDRSENTWKISGIIIQTDENTLIDGDLSAGNLVQVSGWVLDDGSWLGSSILRLIDDTRAFEFSGKVDSLEPWIVAGVEFETRDWTHIDENILENELVKVSGQILEDGTWVAYEIVRVADPGEVRFILIGMVTNMQPWIVSGITLNIDDETLIPDEISLGMLVRVEIQVLANGTWKILSILPVEGFTWKIGCQDIVAQLVHITNGQIQLQGWPEIPLDDAISDAEDFHPNSILLLQICFNEDGSVQVISIIVIYQPPVEEIEEPEQSELINEKVMICHKPNGKNPHTIVVSRSAVPAHLGHGDHLGPCP